MKVVARKYDRNTIQDGRYFGRELPRLGGVTPCLPACLVSVARPPFIYIYR